jgi:uncharacterized membrane protein (DUF106 family)
MLFMVAITIFIWMGLPLTLAFLVEREMFPVLDRKFLGCPVYGWLMVFAIIGWLVWVGLGATSDTCSLEAGGLECGE